MSGNLNNNNTQEDTLTILPLTTNLQKLISSYCDLRGQIKGITRTFTSIIIRSVRYGHVQYQNYYRTMTSFKRLCIL